MKHRRGVALILVGLAGLTMGVSTAWMSDSGSFRYTITAAQPDGEGGDEKVWICKLAGPPAEPKLAPGKNPLQVSVNSIDAQEAFSDAHPSYVVASGDVVCVEPTVSEDSSGPVIDEAGSGAEAGAGG